MNPTDLLRDVPTIDEWAASIPDLAAPHLTQIGEIEAAYWTQHAIRLPAFDDDGFPTMPPDEHITDGFARRWLLDDESAARRADFGTVAVVSQRMACDSCGWGSARYESSVGPRRNPATLCMCCLDRLGDRILGPGHSVMMLLPEEIPDRVLGDLMVHLPLEARASWTKRRQEDGWDPYRRWGFAGPDARGRLYAVILNVQLSVELGPLDAVELVAQLSDIRSMYTPGGDTHLGPRNLDELDVRAFLLRVLEREVKAGKARDELDSYFAVSSVERDDRATSALERMGGDRWLRLGEHPIAESADHQLAVNAAEASQSSSLLAALARSHPDTTIRRTAIRNLNLDQGELAGIAAADRDGAVSRSLLEREDLSAQSTADVVEALLLAGSLDHNAMHVALRRPDFPERLVETAAMRIASAGTSARIDLAREVHEAPAHRRDAVHLQLLGSARKIESTAYLLEAVIGPDEGRARWLSECPYSKVRDLIEWRARWLSEGPHLKVRAFLEWREDQRRYMASGTTSRGSL